MISLGNPKRISICNKLKLTMFPSRARLCSIFSQKHLQPAGRCPDFKPRAFRVDLSPLSKQQPIRLITHRFEYLYPNAIRWLMLHCYTVYVRRRIHHSGLVRRELYWERLIKRTNFVSTSRPVHNGFIEKQNALQPEQHSAFPQEPTRKSAGNSKRCTRCTDRNDADHPAEFNLTNFKTKIWKIIPDKKIIAEISGEDNDF